MQNKIDSDPNKKSSFLNFKKNSFPNSSFSSKDYSFNIYDFFDKCENESEEIKKFILSRNKDCKNWRQKAKSSWEKIFNNTVEKFYPTYLKNNVKNIDHMNHYNPEFVYYVLLGDRYKKSKGYFRYISDLLIPKLKEEISKTIGFQFSNKETRNPFLFFVTNNSNSMNLNSDKVFDQQENMSNNVIHENNNDDMDLLYSSYDTQNNTYIFNVNNETYHYKKHPELDYYYREDIYSTYYYYPNTDEHFYFDKEHKQFYSYDIIDNTYFGAGNSFYSF